MNMCARIKNFIAPYGPICLGILLKKVKRTGCPLDTVSYSNG